MFSSLQKAINNIIPLSAAPTLFSWSYGMIGYDSEDATLKTVGVTINGVDVTSKKDINLNCMLSTTPVNIHVGGGNLEIVNRATNLVGWSLGDIDYIYCAMKQLSHLGVINSLDMYKHSAKLSKQNVELDLEAICSTLLAALSLAIPAVAPLVAITAALKTIFNGLKFSIYERSQMLDSTQLEKLSIVLSVDSVILVCYFKIDMNLEEKHTRAGFTEISHHDTLTVMSGAFIVHNKFFNSEEEFTRVKGLFTTFQQQQRDRESDTDTKVSVSGDKFPYDLQLSLDNLRLKIWEPHKVLSAAARS